MALELSDQSAHFKEKNVIEILYVVICGFNLSSGTLEHLQMLCTKIFAKIFLDNPVCNNEYAY